MNKSQMVIEFDLGGALRDDHTITHQPPSRGVLGIGLTVLLAGAGVTLLAIAVPVARADSKLADSGAAVEVLTDVTQALTQDIQRPSVPAMQRGRKLARTADLVDALRNNNSQRITGPVNQAIVFNAKSQTTCDITPALFNSSGLFIAHSIPVRTRHSKNPDA